MNKINFKNLPVIILSMIVIFIIDVFLGRLVSKLLQLVGINEYAAGLLSAYSVAIIIALEVTAVFNEFIREDEIEGSDQS